MITAAAIDEIAGSLRPAPRADPFTPLTHAERQIAGLVRRGMTNQEIADHLVISRPTVESHLSRIFPQTHVRTRTQLATLPVEAPSKRRRGGSSGAGRATPAGRRSWVRARPA